MELLFVLSLLQGMFNPAVSWRQDAEISGKRVFPRSGEILRFLAILETSINIRVSVAGASSKGSVEDAEPEPIR